jgi:sugar lactone lactonase YvrE
MKSPFNMLAAFVVAFGLSPLLAQAQSLPAYTFAGNGSTGTNNGFGSNARFDTPMGVTVDAAGNLYVADMRNGIIRKISPDGLATNWAGRAGNFGSSNGPLSDARFAWPQAVAVDTSGAFYVADTANAVIRKISPAGIVTNFAGSLTNRNSFDGSGTNANFYQPLGLAVDGAGNLWVADSWNHTIRKATPSGTVSTLAGLPRSPGCADGPTNKARFNRPAGIALDAATNLFVADSFNHIIRKITPAGQVTTIAGLAGVWGNADGTNNAARFFQPEGIAVLNASNLFVADTGNHVLRKISASGTNWVVTTVAGEPGVSGFTNGTGAAVRFAFPSALATDAAGNLFVADAGNHTIRTTRLVPPTLRTSRNSNSFIVVWANSAEGFILESSSALGPAANWVSATNGIGTQGDDFTRTNPLNGQNYFRLRKP